MFVLPLILAAAASISQPDLFIQRVVDLGVPGRKILTQGALPPGWTPPAPLPQGLPLLGTVNTANIETEIYYAPSDARAAAQQYEAQLRAAGYRERLGVPGQGGFSIALFLNNLTVMCNGDRGVSINVPSNTDLRVNFSAATLGPCAPQVPRFRTPVPNLIAPPGAEITGGGGTGGGMTYGQFNMSSSAMIKSALPAKQLMAAFAEQMRAAHWEATAPFASPQGAAQRFTYDRGTQHWNSVILIFRGASARTYDARLEANGTPDFGPAGNLSPTRPARRLSVSQIPAALQLAQRVADTYASTGAQAQLYVGKIPPFLDKRVPLPSGSLIGGMSSTTQTALYYDLTRSQFDGYVRKLRASGWEIMPQEMPFVSGFAMPGFNTATAFCKSGLPTIIMQVRPNTSHVQIGIATSAAPSCSAVGLGQQSMQWAPVPRLIAPDGVKMQPGSVGVPGGQSGAMLTTTQPLSTLLSNFAAQFTAKGWTSTGAPVVSDALGSQSFNYTDNNGKKWQAVLTIYRSSVDPKTYYAFIDATQL